MLRLGDDPRKAKLLAMLQLTVRGVPFIYYGEELGLSHVEIPAALGLDPIAARFRWVPRWLARRLRGRGILLNRDECRLPMPWTAAKHAGFSPDDVAPWLPLDPRSATINVAAQDADPDSLLSTYRRLLRLRRAHAALHRGALELSTLGQSAAVLAYRRFDASDEAHVMLNLGNAPVDVELPAGVHALHSTAGPFVEVSAGRRRLAPYEGIVCLPTRVALPGAAAAGTPPRR
jgi:glycosidase